MKWVNGDIWIYHKLGSTIVIPTNAGWKSDGNNVMGRGLAKQASEKFKDLSLMYGQYCKIKQPHCYFENKRLILVPSKKLNEKQVTIIKDHLALVFDKVTPDRDSERVKINMNSILEKKQEPEGLSVKPINQKGFGGKRPQVYC